MCPQYKNLRSVILYKDPEDVTLSVKIEQNDGVINLLFSADDGKFGTDEIIDHYNLTPDRLLQILQDRGDYTEEEL